MCWHQGFQIVSSVWIGWILADDSLNVSWLEVAFVKRLLLLLNYVVCAKKRKISYLLNFRLVWYNQFSRPFQFAVRFSFPCTVHHRTSAVVWHQVSFLQWLNSKSPEKKICNPAYNASFASRWRTHQRFIVTSKSQTIIEDMLQPSGPAGCCYSCRLAACVFDMTSDNARYTNSYELRRTGCVIVSLGTVQWPSLWWMSLSKRKRKR